MEKNVLNEIHNNGFAIVKNAFSKKLVNDLFDDLKKLSQVKMRSTNSTNLIDSKLIINPHSQSVNYLKVINSKITENYCLNFLNDKFYKIINKKLPIYLEESSYKI
ncbi:hypothetical protein [Candidatus Pelagibacter sp. Uisw_130]|uniref:hypothetical protein n=1 Tax=Candidatus Pelagibacter sp. Uisw_130 TaxID=3230989 RepID=UPI0039EAD835